MSPDPARALADLWRGASLPAEALDRVDLPGDGPVLPSSFAVGVAAQASLAAAALAAAQVGSMRSEGRTGSGSPGTRPRVSVARRDACAEATGWFSLDGRVPDLWDPLSGLYPCGADVDPGWVRIHANFAHHRDGALRLLGLAPGATRADVERALRGRRAGEVEAAAADAGLVVAAARSFEAWDDHPQGRAIAGLPPVSIERIDDGGRDGRPARGGASVRVDPPFATPAAAAGLTNIGDPTRPLEGLRVLDLTRILAGPVGGRTLAASGADVMLVNSPSLPNIDAIADTSRGKRSVHVDLKTDAGRETLRALVRDAHVFQQGYRPGALEAAGFGPRALAALRPGIVCVSLSAYGHAGPWSSRRGFDSLVQTASGFNLAEARAADSAAPKAMPVQILDVAAGFLMAFGALAALSRQAAEGGSWQVRVSLAGTGLWLRSLGRLPDGFAVPTPSFDDLHEASDSGFGRLVAIRHAVRHDGRPTRWARPSRPPGSDAPAWTPAA